MSANFTEKITMVRAFLKANPELVDKLMSELSPEAQEQAKKLMAIFLDESKEGAQIKDEIEAIKSTLSPEILAELDAHRDSMAQAAGFSFSD